MMQTSDATVEIPLWPEGIPGRIKDGQVETTTVEGGIRRVVHVHEPTLIPFLAATDRNSGAAVLICPGGGYGILAIEHEGTAIAQWLNTFGVNAFVVKYRMAPYKHPVPLMDAQRALRLVRLRASEWSLDPRRVGIMGFSAGGHLASTVATHFDDPVPAADESGQVSCRPDFAILGYPVVSLVNRSLVHKGSRRNLLGRASDRKLFRSLSAEHNVTANTPPIFFFHAKDDGGVVPEHSLVFAKALRDKAVGAEVVLLDSGGHGFGLRKDEWAEPCIAWLRSLDVIADAQLSPTIEVRGDDFDVGVLTDRTTAFTNRDYVLSPVPERLSGRQFTRLSGGVRTELAVTALRDTTLHAATATPQADADIEGWTECHDDVMRYSDPGNTSMRVFSRELHAGETVTISQANWSGMAVITPRIRAIIGNRLPDHSKVPGTLIDHIPAATGVYIGSPSIVSLADSVLLASHDLFGPNSGSTCRATTRVFRSPDGGKSWQHAGDVDGMFWGTLFTVGPDTFLMGTDRVHGSTIIRKSTDGGSTWTQADDANTGVLLSDGKYHCAPVPVVVKDGRIWRAMEDAMGPGGWGHHFRSFMMSAPLEADLLRADAWTCSERLGRDPAWLDGRFGGWLEGNAVQAPDGSIVNILRVDDREAGALAAIVRISPDGRRAHFDPERDFVSFPGANTKFTIRYDQQSRLYWSLTNYVPPSFGDGNKGAIRNTLALTASSDLRTWEVRTILLFHPDPLHHAFQYPDWQFDGNDIIAMSRTAYDDGMGGAHNYHDANYLTFHRIRGFRALNMDDADPAFVRHTGHDGAATEPH